EFGINYILNPEGKIDLATSTPEYQYYLKDHLGNTRVVFNGENTVKQDIDYYPFGLTANMNTSSGENKYLFNGKEIQDEMLGSVNLDHYDFHARQYDPALGRFTTMDPHAENYFDWTPYNFVGNNPINLIDPNGMDWYTHNETGNLHWYNGMYEDDNIPDGYSYLGADDYFGEQSFSDLQEAQSIYQDAVGEELSSMDFNEELSEAVAAEYGFELKTKEASVHEQIKRQFHAEGDGLIILDVPVDIDITPTKRTYLPERQVEIGHVDTDPITRSETLYNENALMEHTYTTRTYKYGHPAVNAGKIGRDLGKQVTPWGKVGETLYKLLKKL
ncbi:MAG: RHS repeat-associated core domain-containing protein, partial [Bacteroidota bacterium]